MLRNQLEETFSMENIGKELKLSVDKDESLMGVRLSKFCQMASIFC